MKKRLLSILLTLCMLLSLLPTVALAAGGGSSEKTENSKISVETGGTTTYYDKQEDGWNAAVGGTDTITVKLLADWKAAPTSNAYKTSFGTGAGFGNGKGGGAGYILVPSGKTITLDLNDYTINRGLETAVSEGKVIEVKGNLTLQNTNRDSNITGTITGANSDDGYGAVYVDGGSFTMEGGSITGNKSNSGAGGVFLESGINGSNNSLTVGGTAQIRGNTLTGDSTPSNVFLQNITNGSGGDSDRRTIICSKQKSLASGATIGVTTETKPTAVKPVAITDASSADYSQYFFSDNAAYHTINTNTSGSHVVKLAAEQFTLPLGGTYYFDLSSEAGTITNGVSSTMGTINIGAVGQWGYPAVPDPTLHYVPFTYAGTVNAYSLESSSSNNTGSSAAATASDRSLFVADYNVSHTKTWSDLNGASLIFGKTVDANYKLRSLSAGSSKVNNIVSPATNEWDSILGKRGLTDPIKNWGNIYSRGQDTYSEHTGGRTIRGSYSVRFWDVLGASDDSYGSSFGWRPALEVLNPATLTSDGLKAVALDLNGGSFDSNGSVADGVVNSLNIVCADTTFKAPSGTGLTLPAGKVLDKWQKTGDTKTTYVIGASIPYESGLGLTALLKDGTPATAPTTATFAATGADSGTVTAGDSDKYSIDGGLTYTDFTGATATITGGITAANGVCVVKKGDNMITCDSNPLKITVTQAPTPTLSKTDCTTSTSNDGTITSVDNTMEYKKSSETTYKPINDTKLTGLALDTYKVRVKAKDAVLASADASVTISYNGGGGGGGGGGGDYIPPVQTTVDSGKEMSASNLDSLAGENKALTINGKDGAKLVLDADTVKALAKEGGNLVVTVGDAKGKLTPEQAAQAGDRPVYDLTAILGGKLVTSFGGKVTVSLPYAIKDGENPEDVTVWYLASDGSMTEIPATYDPKTGLATFTVTHFSEYVVGIAPWVNPFTDVKAGDWYYDAVKYVNQNKLFNGVTATTFAPDAYTTRAMVWTVLARQAGQGTAGGANWYEKAQAWAMAKGITDGTNPTGEITREQLVTMLWRYSAFPTATGNLNKFSDSDTVADYAKQAMMWAVEKGLVQGANGALMPQSNATRSQVAAIMMRYCENVKK